MNVNVSLMEQNEIQINDEIMINVDGSVKNIMYVKQIILGILLHAVAKMENLANIMNDSAIICDEITDVEAATKSNNKETNFHEKNITCKTQNVYILIAFVLMTIRLLMAVSI